MATLLANVTGSLAAIPSSHSVVASSPSSRRIADTKSWNEAFDGAIADAPRPLLAGEVEDAHRQLFLGDDLGIEGEDPLAPREADPTAVAGVKLLGDELEHGVVERAEQVTLVEVADGPGRLREEHVGGRLVALLFDQQGEVGRVAVAHVDVDARLLGEAVEDRCDELLGASGIDDHRVPPSSPALADPVASSRGRRAALSPQRAISPQTTVGHRSLNLQGLL